MDLNNNFYSSLVLKYEVQVTLLHLWSLKEEKIFILRNLPVTNHLMPHMPCRSLENRSVTGALLKCAGDGAQDTCLL